MYRYLGEDVAVQVDQNGRPVTMGLPALALVPTNRAATAAGTVGVFGLTWPQLGILAAILVGATWFLWPRPRRHRGARARRP